MLGARERPKTSTTKTRTRRDGREKRARRLGIYFHTRGKTPARRRGARSSSSPQRVDSRSPIIPCREQRSRRGKEARGRSRPERRRARPFPHVLSLRYSEVSTKGPQRESGTFGRAFPSRYRRRAGKSHRRKTRVVFVPD